LQKPLYKMCGIWVSTHKLPIGGQTMTRRNNIHQTTHPKRNKRLPA
jgi:hypothetical protein